MSSEKNTPESIEIQCRVGDPIATPLVYQTLILMRALGVQNTGSIPLTKIKEFYEGLKKLPTQEQIDNPLALKWLTLLGKLTSTELRDLHKIQSLAMTATSS